MSLSGLPGLPDVIDSHAASHPASPAACDASGTWTHAELRDASLRLAAALHARGIAGRAGEAVIGQPAPQPLAVAVQRGRQWYALCLAAWRLGIPVAAVSDDISDKEAERARNTAISKDLRPFAAVVDSAAAASALSCPIVAECPHVLQLEELLAMYPGPAGCEEAARIVRSLPSAGPDSVLIYAFTGGTTKHSKCVITTQGMTQWELANYAHVYRGRVGREDRVLQYSSVYWGAAAFGQIDIAVAAGACTVFAPAPRSVDAVAATVAELQISVLGTVPSQLRGAFPGGASAAPKCLRTILTWGEKLPVKLARQWTQRVAVIELLIASEYYLALHSDCAAWHDTADGTEKHILQPLPNLDMLIVNEDGSPTHEGDIGEMLISGLTVSPGYLGADGKVGTGPENAATYSWIGGRLYFRTRDQLRRIPGGGLVYCGRKDALVKRGGAFVDLEAVEAKVASAAGVSTAAVVAGEAVDVFLALEPPGKEPLIRVLDRVRKAAGLEARLHVRSELPLHPATAKVDRRGLKAQLDATRAREEEYQALVFRQQRRMALSYARWYLPALLILAGPTLAMHKLPEALGIVLLRLLLFPYVWTAMLFTSFMNPQFDKGFYTWRIGPPDIILFTVACCPTDIIGLAAATAFAFIGWRRDRNPFVAVGYVALCAVLAMPWIDGAESEFNVLEGMPDSTWTLPTLCVAVSLAMQPRRIAFFASLPVPCFLVLPKWLGDDWIWRIRCDEARLRHFVVKLLKLSRPDFDGSFYWQHEKSMAWQSLSGNRPAGVRLSMESEEMAVTISYRKPPWPAVTAPEASTNGNGGTTNGAAAHQQQDAITVTLAGLVERAGSLSHGLGSLDSLQAITLAEMIRREVGREVSVTDVLGCSELEQLAACVRAASPVCASSNLPGAGSRFGEGGAPDADGFWRVFTMQFPRHPVDWCNRYDGPGHLDPAALQRAVDRLIARHSALRTIQSPDEPLRELMDKAAAMWQVWVSADSLPGRWLRRFVGNALFACWPRTVVRPASRVHLPLKIPKGPRVRDVAWDWATNDEYVHAAVRALCQPNRWPLEVVLVPLYKGEPAGFAPGTCAAEVALTLPPEEVSWYIYCHITHAYSDGASGQALFSDLLQYYAEESGRPCVPPSPDAPEHLALLQRRLRPSLHGRPRASDGDNNNDVYHEIVCEDWGKRRGYTRRFFFAPSVLRTLRSGATEVLGCSVDIAWLTAVLAAVYRMFPDMPCHHVMLKVGCRDGPGERQMVGFLSEQRIFAVDVGDPRTATLAGLSHLLATTRRSRAWRAPAPFEMGLCIYVNIVSWMGNSLPHSFHHVPKPSTGPWRKQGIAYNNLNLRIDQLSETDWDFRIFHWDAAWGWEWSTQFAYALGAVIADMASSPSAPLLPRAEKRVPWVDWSKAAEEAAGKRPSPEVSEAAAVGPDDANPPPQKAPRTSGANGGGVSAALPQGSSAEGVSPGRVAMDLAEASRSPRH